MLASGDFRFLLFAIPNGGLRSHSTALKLQREGLKPGVPDLFLAFPVAGKHGLFIEMKTPEGQLSREQKECIAWLESHDYQTVVCKTLQQFKDAVNNYLNTGEVA